MRRLRLQQLVSERSVATGIELRSVGVLPLALFLLLEVVAAER